MDRAKALGEEKVSKLLWRFSIPGITGMLVNSLYNVADSIFVGHAVGEVGLAAVTIAFPIMMLLMGISMLIGVGASTLISLYLGRKKIAYAERILGNAFTMNIILTLLCTTGLLLWLEPVLKLLGATDEVLPHAYAFTHVILLGCVFTFIGMSLNSAIRAEGNPSMAMSTMIIGAVLNVILNPLFLFVFHMGIAGSALATVVSSGVTALWTLWYFVFGKSILKLRAVNLWVHPRIIKNMVKNGMPPFLMQIVASTIIVLFNYNFLKFGGDVAVAAGGIINRVSMLLIMPVIGISQGAQPIIGYNYGARNYQRVLTALKLSIGAATIVTTAGFIIVELFYKQIIIMFNANAELTELGSPGLRIMLIMLPLIGFQVIGSTYFQAIGRAGMAAFTTLSRQVILLIPMLFVLPLFWGLSGVWWASPLADLGSALITGFCILREVHNLRKLSANV